MSDEPTLTQILARIEDVASTTASMRVEFNDALTRTRSNVLAELDKTRIEVTGLADRQSGLFTELGKTRSALMEKMQSVRDDVTVNLAAAHIAEQAGRGALEQGHVLADALNALTRQVRQLEDRFDALRNGKDK
ncbi:MAG TPA: hypothetical protein VKI44_11610 [Acetobacteraceae bacterium]|nr:hypothetical protein [Acetobacteraceae bacterium]